MAKTLFQISQSQDESPLGLYASWPTPDARLNFYNSSLTVGSGSKKIIPTVNGQVFDSIVDAFINFQNQSVSNAADFDITWPTPNIVGRFRRVGFSLSTAGKIKATFSAEFTTEAGLPNGGTLLDTEGFSLGYIDLVCTSTSGFFKTAGSATNIIEASKIYRISASGADYTSGPSSSVDNAITRFSGTTGKIIKSGAGTITDAGVVAGLTGITSSGTATFSGILVNSANTTNTQTGANVNLTNSTTVVTRLTGAITSVGGYAVATSGRRNIIINATASSVTIINEDATVTATNRIVTGTGGNIVLVPGASIEMIYNATSQRHQVIGHGNVIYDASRALVTDVNGNVIASNTTAGEIGFLSGVTSSVQTQLDDKVTGPASATNLAIARFNGTTGKLVQSGTGTITTAGAISGLTGITSSGTATFSGAVVNSSNTENTQSGSNVNLTNATTAVTRLTNAGLGSVGGYANSTSGRRNVIINSTGNDVQIINEDTTVTAANRIITGTGSNFTLANGASIELIYNATTARHQVIGGVGGGVGGGGFAINTYPILDGQTNTLIETITDKSKAYDITYSVDRSAIDTVYNAFNTGVGGGEAFSFSNTVFSIAVQSDGKILVGGQFTNYSGQTGKDRLIRLNSDGTEDTAFSTNAVVNGRFSGNVNSITVQSDGKILVTGAFQDYAGQTGKSYLIRLNSDGTEDTAFSTNAVVNGTTPRFNGQLRAATVQSDGKILIGGSFTNYSGQTGKSYLIRLNSDGTEDTAFSTNAVVSGTTARFNSFVNFNSIVVQSDGKILVGGDFTNYSGQTGKNRLIRFNSNGTEDTAFSTNAVVSGTTARFSFTVSSIAVQSDGKILVGGQFTNYSGQTGKNRLIRLNSDGTEDTAFSTNAVVSGTTPRISNTVQTIAVQSDGKILVGGQFTSYSGQTGKSYLIRLNSDGTEDTAFSTNAVVSGTTARFSFDVNFITVQSDGKILVGGQFTSYNLSSRVVRLNSDGTSNTPLFAGLLQTIAVQSDGKILVGGQFTNYSGQTGKDRLIRLNSDGTEDTAFSTNAVVNGTTPRFSNEVLSITVQSDGKILIGGAFINYSGQTGKDRLIRLNSDGTEDTAFSTNAVVSGTTPRFSLNVSSIVVQSDGKILVGGFFSNYSGQTGKDRLIRLNSNGTEDTAFSTNAVVSGTTPRFSLNVFSIAVQSDGKILIGGAFINYSGQTGKNRLIRLNSNGTEDTAFSTNAVVSGTTPRIGGSVFSITVQSDGKILVGGQFTSYSGQTGKDRLIRLNSDGTEDTAFSTNAVVSGTTPRISNEVLSIAVQSDGQILIGGSFTSYSGQTGKDRLIRLNSNGTEDTAFSNKAVVNGTTPRFSANVRTVQSDGKILIGGQFTNYLSDNVFNHVIVALDSSAIRMEIGKLFSIPTQEGFSFSSPTKHGPEIGYDTGVTVSFNSDGTIRYTSNLFGIPPGEIKIEIKEF
jgi:uncharacterized delta-60 repeat protein